MDDTLKSNNPCSSYIQHSLSSITNWYNPADPVISQELSSFTEGVHYISIKQAPCALTLRYSGSSSIAKDREMLENYGFVISDIRTVGVKSSVQSDISEVLSLSDSLSGRDTEDVEVSSTSSEEEIPYETVQRQKGKKTKPFVVYEDPWMIFAGRSLAEATGKPMPELKVWQGDLLRLSDPLPVRLLGPNWKGGKNRIRFTHITEHSVKLYVLEHHTHWGAALRSMRLGHTVLKAWAKTLWKRISSLIEGKPDPSWSTRKKAKLASNSHVSRKARSERLLEVLETVDGMFIQRWLAFPEEVWNWERYDQFILQNLSCLISDEFIDGEINNVGLHMDTFYSQLKRCRKSFKELAHKQAPESEWTSALENILSEAPWLSQMKPMWHLAQRRKGARGVLTLGILSQTRGCGTPPPLVVIQSKEKFLRTVSKEPEPYTDTQLRLLEVSLDDIISSVPDAAFTGLSTKARVTVTSSACWEQTRRDGGTSNELHDMLVRAEAGTLVPIVDLDTGKIERWAKLDQVGSIGEYIFWACLERVLRTSIEEVTDAYLTVVKEPGKGRSVTKARACLKIVLDFVSKICAEPMKKGIPTSKSGMSEAHHGWNFFLELMNNYHEELFDPLERTEEVYGSTLVREDVYRSVYVSSTDYEEATDRMHHEYAKRAAKRWMTRCGIPAVLRGVVLKTCFGNRRIFFSGTGCLSNVGEAAPDHGDMIRYVNLRCGVLMGDPITKITLHLVNLVVRHMGNQLLSREWCSQAFTNGNEVNDVLVRGLKHGLRNKHG